MLLQSKFALLSIFLALSIILYVLETFIPRPAPWFRLGLSNAFILFILIWFGWKEAFTVAVLRTITGSMILGNLFSPSFILSISGSFVSICVMYALVISTRHISAVGISAVGASAHMLTQILIACKMLVGISAIKGLIFILLPFALISGIITGYIAYIILSIYERRLYAYQR